MKLIKLRTGRFHPAPKVPPIYQAARRFEEAFHEGFQFSVQKALVPVRVFFLVQVLFFFDHVLLVRADLNALALPVVFLKALVALTVLALVFLALKFLALVLRLVVRLVALRVRAVALLARRALVPFDFLLFVLFVVLFEVVLPVVQFDQLFHVPAVRRAVVRLVVRRLAFVRVADVRRLVRTRLRALVRVVVRVRRFVRFCGID